MDFYPDLVEASKVIQGFGKELSLLDEKFNGVYSAVEKIGRWEADWEEDETSTDDSEEEEEDSEMDVTLIRDFVDNMSFSSALTFVESRESSTSRVDSEGRRCIEEGLRHHLNPFNAEVFKLYCRVDRQRAVRHFNGVQLGRIEEVVKGKACLDVVKADHVLYAKWTIVKFFEVMRRATTEWEVYFPRDLLWVKFVMEAFESLGAAVYGPKALGGVNLDPGEEKEALFGKVADVVDLIGDKCQSFETTWGMPVVGIMKWEGDGREGVKEKVERWKDLV